MAQSPRHRPVLAEEAIACLRPRRGGVYVDCTFGRGGYSRRLLDVVGGDGRVVALDVDPAAVADGRRAFAAEPRLFLRHSNYDRVAEVLKELPLPGRVDGVVFDLGVSSPQLDDAARGFSFRYDGPLDMRMNPTLGVTAADWVNSADEAELARVLRDFGEERWAVLIARHIARARRHQAITTTGRLAEIVLRALPAKEKRKRKIHPATKVFQAIRMRVNDELECLQRGLHAALGLLAANAVLAVVSFHSLEDRMVKRLFRDCVRGPTMPDGSPMPNGGQGGGYEHVARLIKPSEREVAANARARSARLRAIRRLA